MYTYMLACRGTTAMVARALVCCIICMKNVKPFNCSACRIRVSGGNITMEFSTLVRIQMQRLTKKCVGR